MGNYLLGFLDKSDGDDGKPVAKKDQNENIGEPTPNGRRRNSRRLKIQDPSVDFTKLTDLGASVESNEKGERVVYVETDGPFKKWGIKSGDRLVRMNSKDLTRMDSFAIEKCFQSTKKSELKVHVKRQKSNEKPIPEETETVLKQENSQMVINKNLVRETEECDIIEFHVLWTFFNWIQKFLEPLLGSGPVISHENYTDVNLLPYSNSPTTILKLARKQEIVPHTMRKKKYLVKMHHYKHRIGSNVPGTLVILEFLKNEIGIDMCRALWIVVLSSPG
ncbi:uncharacterized protein [Ptychodera flava]|uniref:uncharacterized protein n=1 Tax=Ptychodera flava TaxID=63121 RepID=UPI003969E1EA